MGCLINGNNKIKIKIKTATSNNLNQNIKPTNNLKSEDQIQIYQKKNDKDLNRQTSISQNIENIIDNNPISFVKIIKKKKD